MSISQNSACIRREAAPYLVYLSAVGMILSGIALVRNQTEGFVGNAVEFKLEDVDVPVRLDDAVHTALALRLLGVDKIGALQAEQEVEGVVEIAFLLSLILLAVFRFEV